MFNKSLSLFLFLFLFTALVYSQDGPNEATILVKKVDRLVMEMRHTSSHL